MYLHRALFSLASIVTDLTQKQNHCPTMILLKRWRTFSLCMQPHINTRVVGRIRDNFTIETRKLETLLLYPTNLEISRKFKHYIYPFPYSNILNITLRSNQLSHLCYLHMSIFWRGSKFVFSAACSQCGELSIAHFPDTLPHSWNT